MPTDLQEIAMALHAVAGAIREAAPKPSSDPRELGESYARGYAAGADEVRRTAPKPLGRHVIGGPVPKAGEKSENVYLREEVADLKAARDEAKRETGEWRKAYDATAMALAEAKASHAGALAEARAKAIEDAAQAAEEAEDPIAVYRQHDGRVKIPDDYSRRTQRQLCAAAIRALAPAQKGGEDA